MRRENQIRLLIVLGLTLLLAISGTVAYFTTSETAHNIVSARQTYVLDSQRSYSVYDGLGKSGKIKGGILAFGHDKGKIDIAFIVKDRPASRKTADNLYAIFLNVVKVKLGVSVLIFTYNDRIIVSPQHKHTAILGIKEILLCRKVEIGVETAVFVDYHTYTLILS